MTTDLYKQRLIGDGAVAVVEDVEDAQRFLGARLMDQILGQSLLSFIPTAPSLSNYSNDLEFTSMHGVDPLTGPYAYTHNPGQAFLRQGTANSHLQISPGTILQKVATAATGTEETLLAFTFDGTLEFAIANGDPSNPRVDILQMSLALVEGDPVSQLVDSATPPAVTLVSQSVNTTRRVVATLSIKQGTPASSPTYPTPDPGYVVIAGVVVGTNYVGAAGFVFGADSAGAVAVVHDQRMPIRLRTPTVKIGSFIQEASHWTVSQFGNFMTLASPTADLQAPLDSGSQMGRVVGVAQWMLDPTAFAMKLTSISINDDGSHGVSLGGNAANNTATAATGFNKWHQIFTNLTQFQAAHAPNAGPTVQAAANGMGPPLWSSGYRCPSYSSGFPLSYTTVTLQINTVTNLVVGPCTWYIAGGL